MDTLEPRRKRRSDRWRNLAASGLILAAFSILLTSYLFVRDLDRTDQLAENTETISREGAERRDQMCDLFEGEHKADVDRLLRAYRFLENLPRDEWGSSLTQAIVRELEPTERAARVDRAPKFCDEPGAFAEKLYERTNGRRGLPPVGLPEPDPIVPARRDFSYLLTP